MHYKNEEKFKDVLAWHKRGVKGKKVRFAVLDEEGINNRYMEGNYLNPLDAKGQSHGSNVAHVVSQVAPESTVAFLPFLKYGEKEKSLQWIADNKPHIVVCSFDYTKASIIKMLTPLLDKTIFVCASGNTTPAKAVLDYPAAIPEVISVGSYNRATGSAISNSNYGDNLTCVSDTFIYVADQDGDWFAFPGTSAAAPGVAGRLGLILSWQMGQGIPVPDPATAKKLVIINCHRPKKSSGVNRIGNGFFSLPDPKEFDFTFTDQGQTFHSKYLDHRGWLK